jgi:hypothetical protein
MGQDSRQQPRAGHDDETQPLKKREGVHLEPVLRDSAVDETVELEAGERDFPLGRREPLELARVGAFETDPLCHEVAFGHRVLHCQPKVRESVDEAGKKPLPCLRVQWGGLETRGGICDVILRTHVRLPCLVALVEDLDPAAGDGLVAFYRGCVAGLARRSLYPAAFRWSRWLPFLNGLVFVDGVLATVFSRSGWTITSGAGDLRAAACHRLAAIGRQKL